MSDGGEQREEYLHADDIARKAADTAVHKVFAILGVDVADPKQVAEFQQDLRFGGKLRRAADRGFMVAMVVGFGIILLAGWLTLSAKAGSILNG